MVTKLSKRSYFFLGSLVLLSLLPLALSDNQHTMHLLILAFIWSVVASAWNLIMGYARVLSFGQIAFFAIGGYTTAMLTQQLGISPYLGILAGGGVALAIGLIIGLICLRLKGIYVGIVTFALHLVLPTFMTAGRAVGTGGSWGLTDIVTLSDGGYIFPKLELVPWYYAAFGMFAGLIFVIYKIINSNIGLAFMALRDSEPLAKNLGVNEYRHLLMVFGICAFITGVMGAFYVHYMSVISPSIFGLDYFLLALIMVMLGGMARFPGAVIGAFVIVFLNDALIAQGLARLVILGAIVVAVMVAMPNGLMGIPEVFNNFTRRSSKKRVTAPLETNREE